MENVGGQRSHEVSTNIFGIILRAEINTGMETTWKGGGMFFHA
jgi:hypothetical protein